MLAWAARHPHLEHWVGTALAARRPRRPQQAFGWGAPARFFLRPARAGGIAMEQICNSSKVSHNLAIDACPARHSFGCTLARYL
jgi:hypothetical protein